MAFYTPLRYPGGKRRLLTVVTRLLQENGLTDVEYAEPYAGGAAVALSLLFEEYASVIHLNDLSKPIFALWDSVVNKTDDMCHRIDSTPVTMDEWHKQRDVYEASGSADLSDLGFATLFLNRTNRSGIIGGGVIGGKQQNGAWSLDARFNKPELIQRIRKIGRYRSRIRLHQMDALDFVNDQLSQIAGNGFAFFDPPYIENGKTLYLDDYTPARHLELAESIQRLRLPWICTYDHAAIELGLYSDCRRIEYRLPYTAQGRYHGEEVMFVSHDLVLPVEWEVTTKPVRLTQPTDRYSLHGVVVSPHR